MADNNNEERLKHIVEVNVLEASVTVHEEKQCYLSWNRGTQSIKTNKKTLTIDESTVTWANNKKDASFKIECSLYQNRETNEWRNDVTNLTLYCGEEAVGKCEFNLPNFIGKEPKYHTAVIVDESYQATGDQLVLKGDVQKFPGAKIKFRVSVLKKQAAQQSMAKKTGRKRKASPTGSQSAVSNSATSANEDSVSQQ